MSAAVHLSLPYPPSANRLWRYVNGRAIKSKLYRSWLAEAGWSVLSQRVGSLSGRYRLEVRATPPDRRLRDVDNLAKPISDALAASKVIENDRKAKSVFFEWSDEEPVPGGRIAVTLIPYPSPSSEEAPDDVSTR